MACSRMPKCEIAAGVFVGLEVSGGGKFQRRLGRGAEIGRAADQPRIMLGNRIEDLAGGFARGEAFGVGRKRRQIGIPASRRLARLHRLQPVAELRVAPAIIGEFFVPFAAQLASALADAAAEMLVDAVGHQKFGVLGPAIIALGELHLLLAERLAMSGAGVLLMRRAVGDVAVDDDQGRPVAGAGECRQRLGERLRYRWRRRRERRSSGRRESGRRHSR